MAPEETIMTRCPSFLSFTAVSTMRDKMDIRGSLVFSSTMELVPISPISLCPSLSVDVQEPTKLNDNSQLLLPLCLSHAGRLFVIRETYHLDGFITL